MNNLNKLSQKYSKYILVGDFNAEDSETCLSNFLFEINAKNVVKNCICWKNVENPSCIDFVTPASLFDFHKMVITVLKTAFAKLVPRKVMYRDYKNFNRG